MQSESNGWLCSDVTYELTSDVLYFSVWARHVGLPEPGQDVVQEADP